MHFISRIRYRSSKNSCPPQLVHLPSRPVRPPLAFLPSGTRARPPTGGQHRESKTPNFIQSRFFENPTVIRSNFAQFAPNNVLKGKFFGYFLGFSKNYRIKSRSNVEKYPIMIRILSNQVIGYFLERDWVFGRSIFTERIFFGVFGSLCSRILAVKGVRAAKPDRCPNSPRVPKQYANLQQNNANC